MILEKIAGLTPAIFFAGELIELSETPEMVEYVSRFSV
jgi:hypothetical protein